MTLRPVFQTALNCIFCTVHGALSRRRERIIQRYRLIHQHRDGILYAMALTQRYGILYALTLTQRYRDTHQQTNCILYALPLTQRYRLTHQQTDGRQAGSVLGQILFLNCDHGKVCEFCGLWWKKFSASKTKTILVSCTHKCIPITPLHYRWNSCYSERVWWPSYIGSKLHLISIWLSRSIFARFSNNLIKASVSWGSPCEY